METPLFTVHTTMTHQDYRKFLYIATFKRNRWMIPMMGIISLAAGFLVAYGEEGVDIVRLLISWMFLFALSVLAVIGKVERRNSQRIHTDRTGQFASENILRFYEDHLVFENEALHSTGELTYDRFYGLLESKDYWIFYFTMNQASMIRKADVKDQEALCTFLKTKFANMYRKI